MHFYWRICCGSSECVCAPFDRPNSVWKLNALKKKWTHHWSLANWNKLPDFFPWRCLSAVKSDVIPKIPYSHFPMIATINLFQGNCCFMLLHWMHPPLLIDMYSGRNALCFRPYLTCMDIPFISLHHQYLELIENMEGRNSDKTYHMGLGNCLCC